jgi:hypothetical protein
MAALEPSPHGVSCAPKRWLPGGEDGMVAALTLELGVMTTNGPWVTVTPRGPVDNERHAICISPDERPWFNCGYGQEPPWPSWCLFAMEGTPHRLDESWTWLALENNNSKQSPASSREGHFLLLPDLFSHFFHVGIGYLIRRNPRWKRPLHRRRSASCHYADLRSVPGSYDLRQGPSTPPIASQSASLLSPTFPHRHWPKPSPTLVVAETPSREALA